jgi:hypothetical protein
VGCKLEKPLVTVTARSKDVACKVLSALASCVVVDENNTKDSLQYNYNVVVMPEGGASLHGTVDAGIQDTTVGYNSWRMLGHDQLACLQCLRYHHNFIEHECE